MYDETRRAHQCDAENESPIFRQTEALMHHINPYNRRSFGFHMKIMNSLILRTVTTVQLKKSRLDKSNPLETP
jgi:hypothetical protein